MSKSGFTVISLIICTFLMLSACQPATLAPVQYTPAAGQLKVLAVETFLADIAQNVAGDRLHVETLMPNGLDPHAFQPTPRDVTSIATSNLLIVNGAGFESWLQEVITNAGGSTVVIEASAGLESRTPREGEHVEGEEEHDHEHEGDPHFWLNPLNVIRYVENIRDGFIHADPDGEEVYRANASAYIAQLEQLDQSIQKQVAALPVERRLIVTNHESFGYFADHYGFTIVGAIVPSVSTGSSPSAQQMTQLIQQIEAQGVSAIFLETGSNPKLAEQIAAETGIPVITDLYTHSISDPTGVAPTYIAMIEHNVRSIIAALK